MRVGVVIAVSLHVFGYIREVAAVAFVPQDRRDDEGQGALGQSFDEPRPVVAALVAVHPPTFELLLDFVLGWQACEEGRAVMDVFPIFSTPQDADSFEDAWLARQDGSSVAGATLPYRPLIAQTVPALAKPRSWKKLDGLAQLLQRFGGRGYEFALLLDAEIGLSNCHGFGVLPHLLREKHAARVWYGDRLQSRSKETGAIAPVKHSSQNLVVAACTIPAEAGEGGATSRIERPHGKQVHGTRPPLQDARDLTTCNNLASMKALATATGNFSIDIWWNDVPYVHLGVARRLFGSWAALLGDETSRQRLGRHAQFTNVVGVLETSGILPTPEEVASRLGSDTGGQLRFAGVAFEHAIYQLYTVLHEGFTVKDLTGQLLPRVQRGSLGENFWSLPSSDQATYLEVVRPLWLPCRSTPLHPLGKSVLLTYHLDRRLLCPRP